MLLSFITIFALLGIFADFFFNGVFVGFILHVEFKEAWSFIYVPFFLACSAALSNWLVNSKWHELTTAAVIAFLCGTVLGHLTLVGAKRTYRYSMNQDTEYKDANGAALLRSPDWPQILFVTSPKVHQNGKPVVVSIQATTDYGCTRRAVIHQVADVDVDSDKTANWVWQIDHLAPPATEPGPGTEDKVFFWCKRPERPKLIEDTFWVREWDRATQPPPLQKL